MTTMAVKAHSVSSKQCGEPGAMMQDAMQPGLRTTGSRLLFSLNEFQGNFNLRRRRGFGSLHYGDARWSNGIADPIRPWHGHYDPARSTVSGRHFSDQRFWIVFDRSAHDASNRTIATASQLAVSLGCRFSGWVHDVFQLRVGNPQPGEGRRPVASVVSNK